MDTKLELMLLSSLEELISLEADSQRHMMQFSKDPSSTDGVIRGLETAIEIIHSFSYRYQTNMREVVNG